MIRKGAADAVKEFITENGGEVPGTAIDAAVQSVAEQGGTPLVVASDKTASASSTSRTSSRAACASASTTCATWASAR